MFACGNQHFATKAVNLYWTKSIPLIVLAVDQKKGKKKRKECWWI